MAVNALPKSYFMDNIKDLPLYATLLQRINSMSSIYFEVFVYARSKLRESKSLIGDVKQCL